MNPTLERLQEERKERLLSRVKDMCMTLSFVLILISIILIAFARTKRVPTSTDTEIPIYTSKVLDTLNTPTELKLSQRSSDIHLTRNRRVTSKDKFIQMVTEIEEQLEELTIANPFENIDYQRLPNSISMTDTDYHTLLRIVEAEAGGEDAKGKRLVTYTILNRVVSDRFPNNVKDVVYAKNSRGAFQYTPLTNGRFARVTPSTSTIDAVTDAVTKFSNGDDETFGAEFFMAPTLIGIDPASSENGANWQRDNLELTVVHGVHEFRRYPR